MRIADRDEGDQATLTIPLLRISEISLFILFTGWN